MQSFSCILKGQEAANIKEFAGSGVFLGGSGKGGFCPNSLCLCPFLVPDQTIQITDVFASSAGVATPAEPRREKKTFFVHILGGEKLLKIFEKCR